MVTKPADLDLGKGYRYGWHDESTSINVPQRGLTRDIMMPTGCERRFSGERLHAWCT